MKKALLQKLAITVFILCIAVFEGVLAEGITSVSQDRTSGVVTITGVLPVNRKNQKSIIQCIPLNLIDSNANFSASAVDYLGYFTANEDGTFEQAFKINGTAGEYTVRIGGVDIETPYSKNFTYYDPTAINNKYSQLFSEIKNGNEANIKFIIEQDASLLGLDIVPYQGLKSAGVLGSVFSTIAGEKKDFQNSSEFINEFYLKMILKEINVESMLSIDTIISENANQLGISSSTALTALNNSMHFTPDKKNMVYSALKAGLFSNAAEFKTVFEKTVILNGVQYNAYGNIYPLLYDTREITGINFSGYLALVEQQKINVTAAIAGKTFSEFTELLSAFNDAVAKAGSTSNTGGGGSGGGSGRGSGGASGSVGLISVSSDSGTVEISTDIQDTAPETKATAWFDDLTECDWAVESINYLASKGILKGNGDKLFRPLDNITREEFVKMLVEGFELSADDAVCSFKDVPSEHWAYKYIAVAENVGLVKGSGEGYFETGRNITREEMAVMCYRTANLVNYSFSRVGSAVEFTDKKEISQYALEAVDVMSVEGIIKGFTDGTFAPKKQAARAEAAKMIHSLIILNKG